MNTVNTIEIKPAILIAKSDGVHIPNGGAMGNSTLAVYGVAKPGAKLEVFDGSSAKGKVIVQSDGAWVFNFPVLAEGYHRITAKVESADLVSEPWLFEVSNAATAEGSGSSLSKKALNPLTVQHENFESVAPQNILIGTPLQLAAMAVSNLDAPWVKISNLVKPILVIYQVTIFTGQGLER